MAFKTLQKSISGMLSNAVFEIPRNQRRYVWKTNHWQDLWDDLSFVIDNEEVNNGRNHFIGSIVLKEEGTIEGVNHYTLIDGQQRTITIVLFLCAIMQSFKEREMADDFQGNKKMLLVTDLKNKSACVLASDFHKAIKKIVELICNVEDKDDLSKIISQSIINKTIDKQIGECVKFYYGRLKEFTNERVLQVRDALINTQYIEIIATTEEDSYTIFEILNARGQVLEDHELLKNYIMRYIRPQSQEKVDEVKEQWTNMDKDFGTIIKKFFKHYASHKYKATPKESIYKVILEGTKKSRDINALFDDIVLKTKYYHLMLKTDQESLDVEKKVFPFFVKKKAEQFRPIILSLMHQREMGKISNEEYVDIINFIYAFYVCYNIIGEERSNKLEDPIYKYAPILENEYSAAALTDFKDSLAKRLPSKAAFTDIFKNVGWSNHTLFYRDEKNKDRVKIVLELLELHIGKRELDENYTIEHILPDSQSEDNAMIGNLLPLEKRLNDQCKDMQLKDKIPFYKRSNYAITRGFAEWCEKNNYSFTPESRNDYLAGLLYDVILGISSIVTH